MLGNRHGKIVIGTMEYREGEESWDDGMWMPRKPHRECHFRPK